MFRGYESIKNAKKIFYYSEKDTEGRSKAKDSGCQTR